MANTTIAEGGVLPNINQQLLPSGKKGDAADASQDVWTSINS